MNDWQRLIRYAFWTIVIVVFSIAAILFLKAFHDAILLGD